MTIQEIVRRLCEHGLTQAEIARRVAASQPQIWRWSKGHGKQSADVALRVQALWQSIDAEQAQ